MAHQFAFQQGLRHGGTVDRHERFVFSGTFHVDGPGDQLFASAALTLNKDRAGIALRHLAHHIEDLLHVATVTNDIVDTELALLGGAQMGDFLPQLAGFEGLLDDNR